jgi:peptidoglycan/xylan/chitin deacetylase (PgdA/CDA1 family)
MMRRLVKTGAACALSWTGADRLIGALRDSRHMPLVIGYHRVVEDFDTSAGSYMPSMLISIRMLERQLDWVGRHFRIISLDEMGSQLERGEPFRKPVAAITFDDGYRDVYDHAFPLLKRKGIPSAVFVVTDLVGTQNLQIYDKLYFLLARAFSTWRSAPQELVRRLQSLGIEVPETGRMRSLDRDPYAAMRSLLTVLPQNELRRIMRTLEAEIELDESRLKEHHAFSWDMLAEMNRAGVTIGSHTRTHTLLTNETWQHVLDQTADSKQELEYRLGITIRHFAYPNGSYNAPAVRAVAQAGYRFAYTTCPHRDSQYPLLTIPRVFPWEHSCINAFGRFSPSIMSGLVNGAFDFAARCRDDHGWSSPALEPADSLQPDAPLRDRQRHGMR